jgi:PHP family Zn ribbon phosphoesterase
LGREANVFAFANESAITFSEITRIIKEGNRKNFLYTIEFYPEEGKYHMDGHASCGVCLKPEQSKKEKNICPVCKKSLTIGVLHRVEALADRSEPQTLLEKFIPHRYIVPLREIIAQVLEVGVASKKVKSEYDSLVTKIGNEFYVLLHALPEEIKKAASDSRIAEAITNMRDGKVTVRGGYDGIFGTVDVLVGKKNEFQQSRLFE